MIDITKNEEDKDKFILGVALKENINSYLINYASGRQEERPFTIRSLNEVIMMMERQYLEYRDQYVEKVFDENKNATLKKLIEALMSVAGLFLTATIPLPKFLQIIIIMILAVGTICYQRKQSDIINDNRYNVNVILTADEFLKRKEDFKIKVIDPNTNLEEDWFLLTLSDIQNVLTPKLINKIADGITPEIKEEEKYNTSEILKMRMKMS